LLFAVVVVVVVVVVAVAIVVAAQIAFELSCIRFGLICGCAKQLKYN